MIFTRILKMGLVPEVIQVEPWDMKNSKGKKKKKDKKKKKKKEDEEDLREESLGCWMNLRFIGNCISSKSKVENSISGTSTHYGIHSDINPFI